METASPRLDRMPAPSRPPRVEPLAVLPVFLPLKGRPVLVAGGSDAAAWKAELLEAAGARVEVRATSPGEAMSALLLEGRAVHVGASWREADLGTFALAVADLEGAEAEAFAAAARRAGVAVNVIDKPTLCTFQFGSIVNRSPVVVGISTDGAAPVLGQAIRRRIEILLPRHLAAWGALAARIRGRVASALASGGSRRRFWEAFAERAFAAPGAPEDEDWTAALPAPEAGSVTLVGAGPGDPEYLTLKGMRALQSADVILFDDLVSPELLELARREARRMLVGKRGGRESCRQEDINALMLRFARQGKRVVRLKAGDPSVFGRSGEEIAALEAAGIPVRVVPGITTASALAAGLNTSLTHRDAAQAVRFVTGHSRKGVLPDTIDWRAAADPATTTVFYMGGRTAPDIAARLLGEGMAPATPVVIAANVSRRDERRWSGPLSELAAGMAGIGHDDPVVIGIGRVFARARADAAEEPVPALAVG
ncbi:siroheme synthase CysG [Xanthobacter sp. V2C-8]|uniref:siroheme synthase CysG n=1 Tax=Xanthobacter albus TaxID=3119929 RepID=UPI00372B6740